MPRSAPINPYNQTLLPTGNVEARSANAQDFGGDMGLGTLAEGLGQAAQAANQVQDDQARIWASTASAQAELATRQKMSQYVNGLNPESQDYPEQISGLADHAASMWDEATSDLQAKAPNGIARRMIAAQMSRAKLRFAGDAIDQQATLNAGYTKGLLAQGLKAQQDVVAASPDPVTFEDAVQNVTSAVADSTTFDPETKRQFIEAAKDALSVTAVQSAASRDPQGFLSAVNAKGGITTVRGTKGEVPTGPDFLNTLPKETQGYVPAVLTRLGSAAPTNADGTASQALIHAVIGQESGGNATAVSSKGAVGTMQVMPATAASIGYAGADLTDPATNVKIGTQYLNQQLKKYGGDVRKALAAYNAGPGAVDKALATASLPQVQPLNDQQIAAAKPSIPGWENLTWPQKVAAVRQAEGLLGKNLASQRGALTGQLEDAHAALLNGQPYPGLEGSQFSLANMQGVYGPDEGLRRYEALQTDMRVGGFMQQVAAMPSAQAQAQLAAMKPAAGPGDASSFQAYNAAVAAYNRMDAARKADPLGYARQNNIAGYQDLDWSDPLKLQKGLPARAATAKTMATEYGTPVRIFNAKDLAAAQATLSKLPASQKVDYLAVIKRGLTDPNMGQEALREATNGNANLAYAANLALTYGTVTLPDGKIQTNRDTATLIAEGDALLNKEQTEKVTEPGGKNAIAAPTVPVGRGVLPLKETDFRDAFNTAVGGPAAFQGPNADLAGRMGAETYNAVKAYYVADAVHRGLDVSQPNPKDVLRAVDAVTGGVWNGPHGKAALFAPQGMPVQQFSDQWAPRATRALTAAGYSDKDAAYLQDHATPVNMGDGKYLFTINGRAVNAPGTKSPVLIDYAQPYAPPAQAPSGNFATAIPAL